VPPPHEISESTTVQSGNIQCNMLDVTVHCDLNSYWLWCVSFKRGMYLSTKKKKCNSFRESLFGILKHLTVTFETIKIIKGFFVAYIQHDGNIFADKFLGWNAFYHLMMSPDTSHHNSWRVRGSLPHLWCELLLTIKKGLCPWHDAPHENKNKARNTYIV
jgi:hypothetical protein